MLIGEAMPRIICATLAALLLSGCGSTLTEGGLGGPRVVLVASAELPAPNGATGADARYIYTVGPYDRLIIDVLGFEELRDRKVQVDGSGIITVPIAGAVQVGGLTTEQAGDRIASQMRRGFVRDPKVAVNLDESLSQYVTVEGEVSQAGNYPIVAGMTLLRAVAAARGPSEFAHLDEVVIHRTVNGQPMVALYSLAAIRRGAYPDPTIFPQDVVVVGNSPSRRLLQNSLQAAPLLISPLIALIQNSNN